MYPIQQITTDALQNTILVLPNSETCSLTINYMDRQIGWFIINLTYNNFQLNGIRIVNSPNLLNQFSNQIPFGLACYTNGNREPTFQQDFSAGNSTLYLLDATEVQEVLDFYANG